MIGLLPITLRAYRPPLTAAQGPGRAARSCAHPLEKPNQRQVGTVKAFIARTS